MLGTRTRVVAVLLAATALALSAGCQPDGSPKPGPSSGAGPTAIDEQFRPFVEAISHYLNGKNPQGPAFLGDCESTTPGPQDALCSVPVGEFEGKEIHGIGRPAGEIDAYLLLERRDADWRVLDSRPAEFDSSGATPADLPPWLKAALATP